MRSPLSWGEGVSSHVLARSSAEQAASKQSAACVLSVAPFWQIHVSDSTLKSVSQPSAEAYSMIHSMAQDGIAALSTASSSGSMVVPVGSAVVLTMGSGSAVRTGSGSMLPTGSGSALTIEPLSVLEDDWAAPMRARPKATTRILSWVLILVMVGWCVYVCMYVCICVGG